MSEITAAFFVGFVAGTCFALAWALHIVERRARRYKEAALHLTVTPELVAQINGDLATQWLDKHGYVWMPRGREFKWPKEKVR